VHDPSTMPNTRQSALSIPATSACGFGRSRGAVIIAQAVRWPLLQPRAKVRSPTTCAPIIHEVKEGWARREEMCGRRASRAHQRGCVESPRGVKHGEEHDAEEGQHQDGPGGH